MKNIPKEIYLNLGIPKRVFDITRDDIDFKQLNGVGWSTDKIDVQDLKFVLSDVSQQRELLERLNKIENWCYNKATDEDLEFLNKIFRSENCG
jgi:hypothetical protein